MNKVRKWAIKKLGGYTDIPRPMFANIEEKEVINVVYEVTLHEGCSSEFIDMLIEKHIGKALLSEGLIRVEHTKRSTPYGIEEDVRATVRVVKE